MSNSLECMGVNEEALQLYAIYKKPYFYYKSRENLYQYYSHMRIRIRYCKSPYQVLQVTCAASERAMKSKVCMIKSLSPYCNNTDGNNLMIFSGIAGYYGDKVSTKQLYAAPQTSSQYSVCKTATVYCCAIYKRNHMQQVISNPFLFFIYMA